MENIPSAIFLTDDAAARLAAQAMGYRVHGTIGILLRSIRQSRFSYLEVIERLLAIPQKSSLHIRSNSWSSTFTKWDPMKISTTRSNVF
jgi:predicted nucleic acid-binding protein